MMFRIAVAAAMTGAALLVPTSAAEATKPIASAPDLCSNIEGKQTVFDLLAGFYERNAATARPRDCVRRLVLR